MARWRLQSGHYLYTDPPTEYTYTEVSRETGRQFRQTVKVPRLLDPKDPADNNYPGEIVVSDGKNAQGRDIIFMGEPTPEMDPLDDEAKKITQGFIDAGRWKKPTDGEVYGEGLIKEFMVQINRLQATQQPVAVPQVDAKAFAALQEKVDALIKQNAALKAQVKV